ncbi:MAG TPA: DUF1015 domain-containing protein [Phycisphaerae bacterium]|nr:DUF1015 domain-containing protein [Phycisphaerae bacterium]
MAKIEAFRGIRYTAPDVSELIAPPYDILTERDKAALLSKDDHNIVSVDLPHVPPKNAGPDRVYTQAAGELTRWLDIRTLRHEPRPAIYAYHQTYKHGDTTRTRKKFFVRLRLEQFGEGNIFPHEQTFGGPKEDRLKLTQATRCNLSAIFGLYPDPENEVSGLFDEVTASDPDQAGILDGVNNQLWVIDDMPLIKAVQVRLSDRPIFIADGHHRYGTALMYRDRFIEEMGPQPENSPVNYVLAVLGGMEDPGATIRPYFRTIAGIGHVTANVLQKTLSGDFTWSPQQVPGQPDRLAELLEAAGPCAMGLYVAKDDAFAVINPKQRDPLASLEPDRAPAWRQLAYTLLHKLVIERLIEPNLNEGRPLVLHYHQGLPEAIKDAKESEGIACLMPATTMSQLREVCLAGELMPQKSTYFHPKLATGMVMNPLY